METNPKSLQKLHGYKMYHKQVPQNTEIAYANMKQNIKQKY